MGGPGQNSREKGDNKRLPTEPHRNGSEGRGIEGSGPPGLRGGEHRIPVGVTKEQMGHGAAARKGFAGSVGGGGGKHRIPVDVNKWDTGRQRGTDLM